MLHHPSPRRRARGVLALLCSVAASLGADACVPVLSITSPLVSGGSAQVGSGVVTIAFAVAEFPLGDQGQRHLHFYVDGDPVPYHFYNGATREVRYQGVHTHFVHWKTASSIDVFGLAPGAHEIRFVLAEADHWEQAYGSATKTLRLDVLPPPAGPFALEPVLTGLAFPVGMAFTTTGRLFFNEWLTGRIRVAAPGFQLRDEPFYTVADLVIGGERGLLGIALDPDFLVNRFVYVYYTAGNPLRNRVIRLTDQSGVGSDETPIVDDLPASNANHNGGVIAFGKDGKLYVVLGDTEVPSLAQSVGSRAGKVLRFNKDGSIPSDNPFPGSPVYALGIRNSFGLAVHPHTGDLWETENGPDSNDEVNRIVRAGNYGWPTVLGIANDPRFVDPILAISPTVAPTGIAIPSERSVYPAEYHDNLFFGDFTSGAIRRISLSGAALDRLGSASIAYAGGQGALLDLEEGADGYLYASSTSGIYRVVPMLGPCNDGFDNDGDGFVDYGSAGSNDPGCRNALFTSREDPECSDHVDNDGDGKTDHPADPQCGAAWGSLENPPLCGLGFELALMLPPLLGALSRRRR